MPDLLFCAARNVWVASSPEEIVRQSLLHHMFDRLGYPHEMVAVEKSLSQLPHLSSQSNLPKRRADLLVFGKDIHPLFSLFPLLLVECKAVKLNNKTLQQITGYNYYVQAPFISVVNQEDLLWGYFDKKSDDYIFTRNLEPYNTLMEKARFMLK